MRDLERPAPDSSPERWVASSAGSVAEDTAAGGGGGNGSEKDNEAANQGAGPVLDSSVSVLEAQARAYNITAGVPAPTLAPVELGDWVFGPVCFIWFCI